MLEEDGGAETRVSAVENSPGRLRHLGKSRQRVLRELLKALAHKSHLEQLDK
jgi:hypothetical protein